MNTIYTYSDNTRLVNLILNGINNTEIDDENYSIIMDVLDLDESLSHTYAEMVNTYSTYKQDMLDYANGTKDELPEDIPYIIPTDIINSVNDIYESLTNNKSETVANTQDLEYSIGLLIDRHNKLATSDKNQYVYEQLSTSDLCKKISILIPDFKAATPARLKVYLDERGIPEATQLEGGLKENLLRLYGYELGKKYNENIPIKLAVDIPVSTLSEPQITTPITSETHIVHDSITKTNDINEEEYTSLIRELAPGKFGSRIHPIVLRSELRQLGEENSEKYTYKENLVKLYEHLKRDTK